MLWAVDAEGFERFSGSWAAEGAEVLDYCAPHLKVCRMGGGAGRGREKVRWVDRGARSEGRTFLLVEPTMTRR